MIHHLYIIPALMEEWGVAEYSVHTQLYTDPDRTGLTMTIHVILNTVHVNVKLQRRPLSFFTLLKRPSLFLKHRHPACTHAVNMRVREATSTSPGTGCSTEQRQQAAGWKWVGAGRDTHRSELFEDQLEEVAAPTGDQHAQGSNLARPAHSCCTRG